MMTKRDTAAAQDNIMIENGKNGHNLNAAMPVIKDKEKLIMLIPIRLRKLQVPARMSSIKFNYFRPLFQHSLPPNPDKPEFKIKNSRFKICCIILYRNYLLRD